jgi:Ras-related GTP-binding protein A/B
MITQRQALIQSRSTVFKMDCLATSIWDETLYRAWSKIVYSLIPNIKVLETQLLDFSNVCAADEVVLFERATFLVISHTSRLAPEYYDNHRFERVSNIIKQFKLSCSKTQSQFQGMEVRNSQFSAFIDLFTGNTFIMVVHSSSDSSKVTVPTSLTQLNISAARKHFERFIPSDSA